jgi:hypothetical protein
MALTGPASKLVAKWTYEIDQYHDRMKAWDKRCDDIVKRYIDKRAGITETNQKRFNMFWSNIQTQLPAMYAHLPKPEIDRRFKDDDPAGRMAAELLQRCASFSLSSQDAHPVVKQSVLDYLLCARGVLWVRYQPSFKDLDIPDPEPEEESFGAEITTDETEAEALQPLQDIDFEETPIDYVHRKDFGHSQARTWEEVPAIWRAVYLSRAELVDRFGEVGERVPLNHSMDPDGLAGPTDKDMNREKKAKVYEIWDKTTRKVYWICTDYETELDERDDPLRLRKFWPVPRPLYATLTNDSLEPIPDFVLYQDQLNMLDELTARIIMVTKSLKVAGCFDASAPAIERILNEGVENTLIPVDSWAAFGEAGGLKGAMQLLPLEEIAQALLHMYTARDSIMKDIYQITGLSDLMRGDTDADETATAQTIKGQFASTRFADRRQDVQHFLRDVIQIMVEITSEHFTVETLKTMSGLQMFDTPQEKQMVMAQYAPQMAQPGQPPQPAQVPDEQTEEKLNNPTWQEVMQLLHDDALRTFRIDIETDSTIRMDEEAEKEAALNYVQTMGEFIEKTGELVKQTPQLGPLLGEMIMFVSRRFKIGRQLEGELESAIDEMKKAAANPPPQQPPIELQLEQVKQQGALQLAQQEEQAKMAQIQAQGQIDFKYGQAEAAAKAETEQKLAAQQSQIDAYKAQLDAQVDQAAQAAQAQQNAMQNHLEAQRDAIKAHVDQQTAMFQAHLDAQKAEMEQRFQILIAQMNNATKIDVAEIAAQVALKGQEAQAAKDASEGKAVKDATGDAVSKLVDMHAKTLDAVSGLTKQLGQPKKIMRDENGKVVGVH